MFILRDQLHSLQVSFSDTRLGRQRAHWFVFALLAVIVPFTSSMTSNLLRSLQTIFGLDPGHRRFYAFMASPKLPWERLWPILWGLIPDPLVEGRLLVALDDTINNITGRKIATVWATAGLTLTNTSDLPLFTAALTVAHRNIYNNS